eukprot:scaffold64996_cov68-Attheya_sp.AAC.4
MPYELRDAIPVMKEMQRHRVKIVSHKVRESIASCMRKTAEPLTSYGVHFLEALEPLGSIPSRHELKRNHLQGCLDPFSILART